MSRSVSVTAPFGSAVSSDVRDRTVKNTFRSGGSYLFEHLLFLFICFPFLFRK